MWNGITWWTSRSLDRPHAAQVPNLLMCLDLTDLQPGERGTPSHISCSGWKILRQLITCLTG